MPRAVETVNALLRWSRQASCLRFPMALHQITGRTTLGLSLALSTTILWATLPVALKFALEQIDAVTLTWFRFLGAFVLFGLWSLAQRRAGELLRLNRSGVRLLLLAAAMLIVNYVLYLFGLDRTTPATSQVLMQLAPLLLAAGGVVVFGERLSRARWLSFGVLSCGLALFCWDRLPAVFAEGSRYVQGSLLIAGAALTWAVYALAQKQLHGQLSSNSVLCFVFGVGSLVLLPAADVGSLGRVDGWHWVAIAFCTVNTLAAYGAFAEALAHVEASRVSAVLAANPLLTVSVVAGAHLVVPERFPAVEIDWLGYVGAACVVTGSAAASLFAQRQRPSPPAAQQPLVSVVSGTTSR